LAFITSQLLHSLEHSDVVFDATDPGFAATGLRVSSTLRLHWLMTVTTSIIQRELGSLPRPVQADVEAKLRDLFEM
jgi:mRNA interferase MazF